MLTAYITGFALSFSLIAAIGAQNAFVLRQGVLAQHVGAVVLFCAISDALLIAVGVFGLALFVADFAMRYAHWLFGGAALWLCCYGLLHLREGLATAHAPIAETQTTKNTTLRGTLGMAALLTFGNPHVYLDTVVLVGTVSLQFEQYDKILFALGAISASVLFFALLGYGARLLSTPMQRPAVWRALNIGIALLMFALALGMLRSGGWY